MRSDVAGELLEMSELLLPTQSDGRREVGTTLGEGYDIERNAVAADRHLSGASEAMAKE